jgi:hypothetical protein
VDQRQANGRGKDHIPLYSALMLLAVLSLAALAGCTSEAPDQGGIEASPEMSMEQAGNHYLSAVCPSNEQRALLNETLASWTSSDAALTEDDRTLLIETSESLRSAALLLESPPDAWPEEMSSTHREDVGRVAQDLHDEALRIRAAAELTTQREAHSLLASKSAEDFRTYSPAAAVRNNLQLPPSDGDDNGCRPFNSPQG